MAGTFIRVSWQSGWRWCNRCGSLYFAHASHERCASTGGNHAAAGSGDYGLPASLPVGSGQDGWRWCHKCGCVFFATGNSRCPAGAAHDGSKSAPYTMFHGDFGPNTVNFYEPPRPRTVQSDWRWCRICQGLFFQHAGHASVCPGGGAHDSSGSGAYGVGLY